MDNKERCRLHYQKNKERYKARAREWKKANPDKVAESGRKYYQNNKEKILERCADYYYSNTEEILARNREWKSKNPERGRSYVSARRKRVKEHCPSWVDRKQIQSIYREAIRISEETGIPHHVDHIHPLNGKNLCGLHVPWNLQIIPARDNMKKSNKLQEI